MVGYGTGSMGGSKILHATQAAIMLNDAIGMIRVPLEIYGFTDCHSAPKHAVFKTFSQQVTAEDIRNYVADAVSKMMDGNSDGESIMWGYQRLLKRREKRKIMIVLSDGSPAGYRGDADAYTKLVIKQIEDAGGVEIYGIGIQDSNVIRLYKDCEVLKDPNALEETLLRVIKRKVLCLSR